MASIDPSKMTDLHEIRAALDKLREAERQEDVALWAQLGRHSDMQVKMGALHRTAPKLAKLQGNAEALAITVGSTCHIAENVSSKVRELDTIKVRLQETLAQVNEVLGLRDCVDGVDDALKGGDLAAAAQAIHKYLQYDPEALRDHTAAVLDAGMSTIEHLELKKSELVEQLTKAFDATAEAVLQEPGRFSELDSLAALYPLCGERDQGLHAYGRFLAAFIGQGSEQQLKQKLGGADITCVALMTALAERVATTIESKSAVVNKHYGVGRAIPLIEQLQRQCDIDASKILEQFEADSKAAERVAAVRQHTDDEPTPETSAKALEPLVLSLVSMIQCVEMYCRYVYGHVTKTAKAAEALLVEQGEADSGPVPEPVSGPAVLAVDPAMVAKLSGEMKERVHGVVGQYICLEEHIFKQNVAKAVALNTLETPMSKTTTLVDDAFFVIAKSARRAMSSLHADAICAILNNIRALLEVDYILIFKAQLKAGLGGGGLVEIPRNISVSIRKGFMQFSSTTSSSGDGHSSESEVLIALNNIGVSREHTVKLKADLESEAKKLFATAALTDQQKISSCLSELADTIQQFDQTLKTGMSNMCRSFVRPRLSELIDGMLEYVTTEADVAAFDGGSPFAVSLITGLESILNNYTPSLLPTNCDTLVAEVAEDLAGLIEEAAFRTTFNRLGGILFDKDIRVICDYLTSLTEWSLRGKFARCSQMATLLCVESLGEVQEYYSATASVAVAGRLTPVQVKDLMRCRKEFANLHHEIGSLHLHS